MIEIKATVPKGLFDALAIAKPADRARIFKAGGIAIKNKAKLNAVEQHSIAERPSVKGGGFWGAIANSITNNSDADGFIVGATHHAAGFAEVGGIISAPGKGPGATKAKFLTIPISEKSYGKTVGKMKSANLKIIRIKNILFGVFTSRGKTKSIEPLFVLKKSVRIRPRPWFPKDDEAAEVLMKTFDDLFNAKG